MWTNGSGMEMQFNNILCPSNCIQVCKFFTCYIWQLYYIWCCLFLFSNALFLSSGVSPHRPLRRAERNKTVREMFSFQDKRELYLSSVFQFRGDIHNVRATIKHMQTAPYI